MLRSGRLSIAKENSNTVVLFISDIFLSWRNNSLSFYLFLLFYTAIVQHFHSEGKNSNIHRFWQFWHIHMEK